MVSVHPDLARKYEQLGYWENISFHGYLRRHAERTPNRLAIIDSMNRVTWGELDDRVTRTAVGLLEMGIRSGDTVALQSTNRIEFFDMRFALQRIGVRALTLAPDLRDNEVSSALFKSNCVAFVSLSKYRGFDYCEMFKRLSSAIPSLRWHVLIDNLANNPQPSMPQWLEKACDSSSLAKVAELAASEVDLLMLTSGTTGLPKLCARNANVFSYRARTMDERIGLCGEERLLSLAPITQGVGQLFGLACPLVVGATVVLMEKFDPHEALLLAEREKVNVIAGVPTHLLRMMSIPEIGQQKFEYLRLIVTGAASCPPAKQREMEELFGCRTLNYYGMGEIGIPAIPYANDPPHIRHETSGRMLAGMELRIVGNQGEDLPAGQRGELLVRGPAASAGYVSDDEANALLFDKQGWARSGDLGQVDDQGVLHILGRKKDLIIRGGLNIVPRELEDLISTHPSVRQVAVIGIPDAELGERACAVASLRPGHVLELAQLVEFLRLHEISTYKLPEILEIRDELPLNPIGKVDARALKAQMKK
jgi:non-ribosomal peptide synthetase component E (peptide arylation enzyme)